MDTRFDDDAQTSRQDYRRVVRILRSLPDHCAMDVGALAERIGADKLELIQWVRADITFARLIESKVTK